MPMPRWEDEDEYLTYMAKVMERIHRDDPPPSVEDRLAKYARDNWIDMLAESVGEADGHFFSASLEHFERDDALAMGRLIIDRVSDYTKQCALVWNIIEEWELDDDG